MTSADCVLTESVGIFFSTTFFINNFFRTVLLSSSYASLSVLLRVGTDRAGQRFGAGVRESVAAMQ